MAIYATSPIRASTAEARSSLSTSRSALPLSSSMPTWGPIRWRSAPLRNSLTEIIISTWGGDLAEPPNRSRWILPAGLSMPSKAKSRSTGPSVCEICTPRSQSGSSLLRRQRGRCFGAQARVGLFDFDHLVSIKGHKGDSAGRLAIDPVLQLQPFLGLARFVHGAAHRQHHLLPVHAFPRPLVLDGLLNFRGQVVHVQFGC